GKNRNRQQSRKDKDRVNRGDRSSKPAMASEAGGTLQNGQNTDSNTGSNRSRRGGRNRSSRNKNASASKPAVESQETAATQGKQSSEVAPSTGNAPMEQQAAQHK